jgi:hypothetical protein
MRAHIIGLLFGALCLAGAAPASGSEDAKNCTGVGWDDTRPLTVAKVTAASRVNFLKSPYDDRSTAASCPAAAKACRKKAYLVPGDLVLVGKAQGDFTCVTYQSPRAKRQTWIGGWLPSAALTPVAPTPSPASDWIGRWRQPGGFVEIKNGDGGKLRVEGSMTLPTPSGDYQNGDFHAQVAPSALIAFSDEGVYGDGCRLRMQRIGASLLVEDNGGCGGAGVTFTGLFRRQN